MLYHLIFLIITMNSASLYAMMENTNNAIVEQIKTPHNTTILDDAKKIIYVEKPKSFIGKSIEEGVKSFKKYHYVDAAQQLKAAITMAEMHKFNIFSNDQWCEMCNMLSYSYYCIAQPTLAQPWLTNTLNSNNQKYIERAFNNLSNINAGIHKFPIEKQTDIANNINSNLKRIKSNLKRIKRIKKDHLLTFESTETLALSYAQGSNGREKSLEKSLYFFNHFLCIFLDPQKIKLLPTSRFGLYYAIDSLSNENKEALTVVWEYKNLLEKYCSRLCADPKIIHGPLPAADNAIRQLLFELIMHKNDKQNDIIASIQKLEAKQGFEETLNNFLSTDKSIAKTILKYLLKNNLRNNQEIHYLLSFIYRSEEKKYDRMIEHLNASKLSTEGHEITNLFTDYKIFLLSITHKKAIDFDQFQTFLKNLRSSQKTSTSLQWAWDNLYKNNLNYFNQCINNNEYLPALAIAHYCNNNKNLIRKFLFELVTQTNNSEDNWTSKIHKLEITENFKTTFENFIKTDKAVAKTTIKAIAQQNDARKQCAHYLLGLIYEYENKHDKAIKQFELSKYGTKTHATPDLFIDYKIFLLRIKHNKTIDVAQTRTLLNMLSALRTNSTSMVYAWNNLNENHPNYFELLINNHQYELAFTIANYFVDNENTRIFIIDLINNFSHSEERAELVKSFFSSQLYRLIKGYTKTINKESALTTAKLLTDELHNNQQKNDFEKNDLATLILNHLKIIPINDPSNKEALAKIYNSLGVSLNNESCFQRAMELGLKEAQLNKALFILNDAKNINLQKEQHALKLLHNYAHGDDNQTLRARAFSMLGEYYFEYESRKSLLSHVTADNEKALQYLEQAEKLGDNDAIGLLGILHLKGIQKDGKTILEKNIDKGRGYLNQQPASSRITPALPEILLFHGAECYKQSHFKKCQGIFAAGMQLQNCSPCAQQSMQLYFNLSLIKTGPQGSPTSGAMYYLYKRRKHSIKHKNYYDTFFNFIDDEVQKLFNDETNRIMEAKEKNDAALNYCLRVGTIYCSADYTQLGMIPLCAIGLECLQYAEEHAPVTIKPDTGKQTIGKIKRKAQYVLAKTCQHLLPIYLCVEYLKNNLEYVQGKTNIKREKQQKHAEKIKTLQKELNDRYPKSTNQQFLLFESYQIHKKDDLALEYLTSIFNGATITIEKLSQEAINALIDRCGKNELLINYAKEFAKNANTAKENCENPDISDTSIAQENAAMIVACTYIDSQSPQLLMQSMGYLNLLEKVDRFKDATPTLLGLVNSQLGTACYNSSPKFAIECFQKAARYQNIKAIKQIALEWLNDNPNLTIKIDEIISLIQKALKELSKDSPDAKYLSGLLIRIHTKLSTPNNKNVAASPTICSNEDVIANFEKALKSESLAQFGVYFDDSLITENNQQNTKEPSTNAPKTKKLRAQQTSIIKVNNAKDLIKLHDASSIQHRTHQHKFFSSLAVEKFSHHFSDKDYSDAMTSLTGNSVSISALEQLADKSPAHPHACIVTATIYAEKYLKTKDRNYYETFTYYLKRSCDTSIIKNDGQNSKFVDGECLNFVLNIINCCSKILAEYSDRKERYHEIITFIKTTLPTYGINMEHFAQLCKEVHGVDLATVGEIEEQKNKKIETHATNTFIEIWKTCMQQPNKVDGLLNAFTIKEKADEHPLQPLLIDQKTSSYATNEQYLKILKNHFSNNTPNIAHLKQLADQSQPHPHACILLATINTSDYLAKKNSQFYNLFEYYLQLSFEHGIIKKNGHDSVFVDCAYLDVLLNVIVKLTEENNETKKLTSKVITFITTILPMHGINMEIFTQFCKEVHGVDLATFGKTENEAKESKDTIIEQPKVSTENPQTCTQQTNQAAASINSYAIKKMIEKYPLQSPSYTTNIKNFTQFCKDIHDINLSAIDEAENKKEKFEDKIVNQSKSLTITPQETVPSTNSIKSLLDAREIQQRLHNHPLFYHLAHENFSDTFSNQNYINILTDLTNSNLNESLLQKLALQSPPHPHACMLLATIYADNYHTTKDYNFYTLFKNYFTNGLNTGIIKRNGHDSQFLDGECLNLTLGIIGNLTENDKLTKFSHEIITFINESLSLNGINMKYFAQMCKDIFAAPDSTEKCKDEIIKQPKVATKTAQTSLQQPNQIGGAEKKENKQHHLISLLSANKTSKYSQNQTLNNELTNYAENKKLNTRELKKLTNQPDANPHAYYFIAMNNLDSYFKTLNSACYQHFLTFLKKSFINGIVKKNNKKALFIDESYTNLIINVIDETTERPNTKNISPRDIITTIKKMLIETGINMEHLTQLCLEMYKINLDDY